MKLKYLISVFIVFAALAGCGEDIILNNITKVGNPLPVPDPSPSVNPMAKYLSENSFWKSSAENGGRNELYLLEFDIINSSVSVRSDAGGDIQIINYTIEKDIIMGSSNGLTITITPRDLEKYPYEVTLTDEDKKFNSLAFASGVKDSEAFEEFDNAKQMCLASSSKIYDADSDLDYDGQYYVAGYVQMSGVSDSECGLKVKDVCDENGMHLYEAVIEKDEAGNDVLAIRTISCICDEGKCLDDLTDQFKLFELFTDEDKCKHFPELDTCITLEHMEYIKQNPLPIIQTIKPQNKLPELNPYPVNIPKF